MNQQSTKILNSLKELSIFFKHDDATRVMEHVKSVLEASVDYHYPNHPEPEAEPGDMGEVSDGYHTFNIRNNIKTI